jgi:hypothetical protein
MPRHRKRACLQQGLKLDLNQIARQGLLKPGAHSGPFVIRWTNTCSQEEIARGLISADMQGGIEGSLRIQIGGLDQTIILIPSLRHYGGCQWYFMCPRLNRRASVLWMPSGARRFASRYAWLGKVAYSSQFMTPVDRAHLGQARIRSRLIGDLDPNDWDLPPRPKWMRWRTYCCYVERFDAYEAKLEERTVALISTLMRRA